MEVSSKAFHCQACGFLLVLQIIISARGKRPASLWQVNLSHRCPTRHVLCSLLFPPQLMSAVKKGHVSDSRLAILMKTAEETLDQREPVSVDRSGGGVWVGCQKNKTKNQPLKVVMTHKKRCKWSYLNDNIAIKHAAGWIWTNQALLCVLGETVSNDWGWDVSVYFICYVQSLNIWCLRPHTQHFILSFYAALLILWRSLCPALLDWRWLLCKYHLQVALLYATQFTDKCEVS